MADTAFNDTMNKYTAEEDRIEEVDVRRNQQRCLVIETVVVLFFIAHGIAIPVNIFYASHKLKHKFDIGPKGPCVEFSHHSNISNNTREEMREMTTFMMYNKIVNGLGIIPAIFFGPVIDRVGRKVGMIIPTIGIIAKATLFYVFINLEGNIYYLLIGCAMESITGGYAVMLLSCYGAIADVTPPGKERAFRFSVIDGLQAIATSMSIVTTGFWISNKDFRNPMILSGALSICLLVLTLTVVKESLENISAVKCSPNIILKCVSVYQKSEFFPGRQWKMFVALACFIITVSVNSSKSSLQVLVFLYAPFCWKEIKLNLYQSLGLVVCWCMIFIVAKVLQKVFNWQDISLGILGCISSVASLLIFAVGKTDSVMYSASGVGVFQRLVIPMIRSFTSRHVLLKEQGTLFAGFTVIEVLAGSFSATINEYIYRQTFSMSRGFVFFYMSGFMIIVLGLMIWLKGKTRCEIRSGYEPLPEDDNPFDRQTIN